jgi:hypothetical protein
LEEEEDGFDLCPLDWEAEDQNSEKMALAESF